MFNLLIQLNRYGFVKNKFIYIQSSFVTMIFVERQCMYFDGYNGYSTALYIGHPALWKFLKTIQIMRKYSFVVSHNAVNFLNIKNA